ncbi:quinol:cytochrome C oxidoreductase, partial [Flavobacteriaceae bacterium]|nr:quinol:cytochrome C oxidoreductase [Flavobacteriaceae bacterium]
MYTFPNKLKNIARALMILGFIGLVFGFLGAPKNITEAKAMVATEHHGEGHGEAAEHHEEATEAHAEDTHAEEAHATEAHAEGSHDSSHDEHLLHQLQNKPWAALYVAAFFFFMIPLGVLAFYAIQRAAQAGWSPVLYRVMEGITGYLLPGGIIVIVILALSGMHFNHLFIWMDPEVVAHDKLIAGKVAFLNVPFFLGRAVFFL